MRNPRCRSPRCYDVRQLLCVGQCELPKLASHAAKPMPSYCLKLHNRPYT